MIGTWIACGTVPLLINYGLKFLNPQIFLIATCLVCCVVSLATGSSWTTAATVGIALIGIERKDALLDSLDALGDAMLRVTDFVVQMTPIGVFAISAAAAVRTTNTLPRA